ncbi:hypothetical protein N7510_010786 [Penicillium lagena]|uniref:uncharacterized protein n=1 Tax=Penicillium lagena TaxID=94218 RepID=UPI00254201B4|nr:uncharacterized protein N7510_010786 [Penicillium lagena]KAJ5601252.1 hypothetical protein N7510_010786 [Penicillium lagena]
MGPIEPEQYFLDPTPHVPNSRLPILVYRNAILDPSPRKILNIIEPNGWLKGGQWKAYKVPHFHAACHECYAVLQGKTTYQLGIGPTDPKFNVKGEPYGMRLTVQKGDVFVLPAGICHASLESEGDYEFIGLYPNGLLEATGQRFDMNYAMKSPEETAELAKKCDFVSIPPLDPFVVITSSHLHYSSFALSSNHTNPDSPPKLGSAREFSDLALDALEHADMSILRQGIRQPKRSLWTSAISELMMSLPQIQLERRTTVYEYLLCFEEIGFTGGIRTARITPHRSGLYLQHNPINHPLAIMSTNHQVYEEARQVFYGLNRFAFWCPRSLPLFLVGIGQGNAMLLRSVRWKNVFGYQEQYEEVAEKIRVCLSERTGTLTSDFCIDSLVAEPRGDWNSDRHKVRPRNTADALDGRERWGMDAIWHRYNLHGQEIYGQATDVRATCGAAYPIAPR